MKHQSIPVRSLGEGYTRGILVDYMSVGQLHEYEEVVSAHRHDFHVFMLLEKGNVLMEIDFEQHAASEAAIAYIHPSQVHCMLSIENAQGYLLAMTDDQLNPDYLQLLDQLILPAPVLSDAPEVLGLFRQVIVMCLEIFRRGPDELYASVLKDSVNTFVGLVTSEFLRRTQLSGNATRFSSITRAFKLLLEQYYAGIKRPAEYAALLHISTSYLNECVRRATGFSVTHHIQQRIILEAKRLLYHSDRSVKEIAYELGYHDHAYFSRFFTATAGMTALQFRKRNPV